MVMYQSKLSKIVAILCFFVFAASAFGSDVTTLYFVPLQIETYAPITRANIVSEAWEKSTFAVASQASRLIDLLTHGEVGEFNEHRVRAAVLSKNKTYFIDAEGVVSDGGKSGIKIDKAAFIDFQKNCDIGQRKVLREPPIQQKEAGSD